MNERLPYEDELSRGLNDLPIPDASGAWEDMKRRLDEEERKRRIIPPIFFRSCLGLAVIGLIVSGIVMLGSVEGGERSAEETRDKVQGTSSGNTSSRNSSGAEEEIEAETEREKGGNGKWSMEGGNLNNFSNGRELNKSSKTSTNTSTNIKTNTVNTANSGIAGRTNTAGKETLIGVKRDGTKSRSADAISKTSTDKYNTASGIKTGSTDSRNKKSQNLDLEEKESSKSVFPTNRNSIQANPPDSTLRTPNSNEQRLPKTVIKDTLVVGVPLEKTVQNPDTVAVAKVADSRKKKFSVSGGIALQQGIPMNGQSTVPYNYYGRKASISDYIPSVYLRLHYGKFFLQGEARYGAPNSVKEVSFARKTTVDSSNNLNERTSRLKKTYYHQLPLSLNYEIGKKLSVGTGFSYNIFQGAVTEEITRTYNASGTQNVKSQIQNIKGYKDSFLYKSQLQWIVHTEYSWKRLALGLRFTYDLEPYIRYTLPSGELKDEKNQTLQAILRFRIF